MVRSLLISFILFSTIARAQVISVATARNMPNGATVTVRGVVTNGAELGKVRYLQDGTAGIAAFPGTGSASGFEAGVTSGDSIEVTGVLTTFHGLLEISPIQSFTMLASNVPLPAPKALTIPQLSNQFEGQLVQLECVSFSQGGGQFSASGTYELSDFNGNIAEVFMRSGHPMLGTAIPGTPVHVNAILSDYDGFQLLVRTAGDFGAPLCFYFNQELQQTAMDTASMQLEWGTNLVSTAKLHYGLSQALNNVVNVSGNATDFNFHLSGLYPGEVYWMQVEASHDGEIIYSKPQYFVTRSTSSGQIKVYFNHSYDPAFANGFTAEGQSAGEVLAETIARIDAAQQTIDVAMYNNNRNDITTALKNAAQRGVQVRYVAALDAESTALSPAPNFPVIFGNSEAIMHDKFMVIDADLPAKCWVMSGSLNWTGQNIFQDYNNTLFIQDQSLAKAYRLEFEEMWGSSGNTPDVQNSRFGSQKTDNTPHQFIIGGKPVFSWFSPSDHTTSHIVDALHTAEQEALFAMFSFTNNDQSDALVDLHNSGRSVRGMIENIDDIGVEIGYLQQSGIQCLPHPLDGLLHHKYGIIDPNASNPTVITGSHNWTFAAETVNDENTLIIHDYRVASLFKAEFERRWEELAVPTSEVQLSEMSLYPNPASDFVRFQAPAQLEPQKLEIVNMLGVVLFTQFVPEGQSSVECNLQNLAPGFYEVIIRTNNGIRAVPFQKIQH